MSVRFATTVTAVLLLVVASLVIVPPARAQIAPPEQVVTITPVLPKTGFVAGETFQAALVLDIMGGYYINAHSIEDPALIPTTLEIPEESPVTWAFTRWPEDQARAGQPTPGFDGKAYRNRVLVRLVGRVPADAVVGELRVPIKVRYQTCTEDLCLFPYSKEAHFSIPIVPVGTEVKPLFPEFFAPPGSTHRF